MTKKKKTTVSRDDSFIDVDKVLDDTITSRVPSREDAAAKRKFVSVIKAEQWWVEQSRKDPAIFFEYVSGLKVAKHHRLWLANIFNPQHKRLNLIAPRESSKTTLVNYAMAWFIGVNPLATNGIISVSDDQAQARLGDIKGTITTNVRYRNVFPNIHLDTLGSRKNTQGQFTVYSTQNGMTYQTWRLLQAKKGSTKDPTLKTAGRGGKGVIGSRFSGILILDDIIDHNDMTDAAQQKVLDYIFKTLVPCVTEEGRIVTIGTRWMIGDVPERLKYNSSWKTIEFPALSKDPKTGELRSYWQEVRSVESLLAKKEEIGDSAFNIMYMNDPKTLTANLFEEEWLLRDLPEPLPEFYQIWITTDQALAMNNRSDFNCYHLVGIDVHNNYYLLDTMHFKALPEQQIDHLISFHARSVQVYGRVDGVLFENIAMQSLFAMGLQQRRPDIPIFFHRPQGDKMTRAQIVSRFAGSKKLYISQNIPSLSQIKSEWMNFPLHRNDDTLDALSLLMQYMGLNAVSAEVTYINASPLVL